MKKLLPATLIVLILAVAGASVYLLRKPGLNAQAATATASDLPAETLLLLEVPDPGQTADDWKTTDLYKIWTEPQVQAFVAKPLSQLPPNKNLEGTWEQIVHLDPKNLFVAVTALDEKNNRPHFVAGFQFKGSDADVDRLLTVPKEQLRQQYPGGKADLVNYQNHSIETFDTGDGNTLASVYLDHSYLIGNDLALLKATVDRREHRAPAGEATLDTQADFQTVGAKLSKNFATMIFARPQVLLGKIYDLAIASGGKIDPAQRAEADKIKALGATTSIEKGKFRDTVYVLAPGLKYPEGTLQFNGLPLASADTLFYSASLLKLSKIFNSTASATAPGSGAAAGGSLPDLLESFFPGLKQKGLTLERFTTAFGRELTVQLDWSPGSPQPTLLASLDVHDPAAATQFVDALSRTVLDTEKWQTTQVNGLVLHSQQIAEYVNLTLTNTDKHLILGLSTQGVLAAVKQEKSGGANFTASQVYKDSVASVHKADQAFAYLDSRVFFERLYSVLKPAAMLGLPMMYPKANDYVELGKLPDAETISKHLTPMVLSQSTDDQGTLMESVGPMTFTQAGFVVGGTVAAAAYPTLQKQYGMFGHPSEEAAKPAVPATPTPESSPSESP